MNIGIKVNAIQVAPFKFEHNLNSKDIVIQREGADADTVGYGVYLRYSDGSVKNVADRKYETEAIEVAKGLCAEHTVSIELYDWQVLYINPIKEGLRKTFPPTIDALQDKAKAWANHLVKIISSAWEDGVVLSIHDRNGPVNPFPVLTGDYPDGWNSYTSTKAVDVPEVNFIKAPEAAMASVVAKMSIVRTPNGQNNRFLGQYIPRDLGPKDDLLDIRPDHPLDPLLAPMVASVVTGKDGEPTIALSTDAINVMTGNNREQADSGQVVGKATIVTEISPNTLDGFSDTGGGKRSDMFQGSLVNVGAIPPVTTEMPKSLEQQLKEKPGHVYDTEGDVKIGVSATSSPDDNARLVEGGLVRASQQAQMDVRPTSTEDGMLISDTPVAKLELRTMDETKHLLSSPANAARLEESIQQLNDGKTRTFESRGDHSPSDE